MPSEKLQLVSSNGPVTVIRAADVRASIARSQRLLPALGRVNPGGALLIEEYISAWMGPTPPADDGLYLRAAGR